jgi:hypothetical protein
LKKVFNQIWVTFKKEGIHKYPAALDDPKLATGDMYDVSFLGYPHRHIFHFTVGVEVSLYGDDIIALDYKSCEMISDDLAEQINTKYPNRKIEITVSEDGENGATSRYE